MPSQTTKPVSVVFTHDDEVKLWEVTVMNATSPTEALQAMNAVILTCHGVKLYPVSLLERNNLAGKYAEERIDGSYLIILTVGAGGLHGH